MAKETKAEQTKRLWFYGGLAVTTWLALVLGKGIVAIVVVFWGFPLSLPFGRLVNKTGWRFSRLEWLLMSTFFCLGLVLLLSFWFLKANNT